MSVYNRLEPEMTSEVTHHVGFVFKDHNIYILIVPSTTTLLIIIIIIIIKHAHKIL